MSNNSVQSNVLQLLNDLEEFFAQNKLPFTTAQLVLAKKVVSDAFADSNRLDYIASEYLVVDPFDMPTGAGDADVGWRFSQYQGNKRVFLAEVYCDDLREGLDALINETAPSYSGN